MKDLRDGYDITIPDKVWLAFNWLTHRRSAQDLLGDFKDQVQGALDAALRLQRLNSARAGASHISSEAGKVITYSKLRELLRSCGRLEAEDRISELDAVFTSSITTLAGIFTRQSARSSPYREAAPNNHQGSADLRWHFRYELSWQSAEAAQARLVAGNTPAGLSVDDAGETALRFPVVNIGPWGRDYHQKWERAHGPYTFEVLPDLVFEAVRAGLTQDGRPVRLLSPQEGSP